MQTETIKYCQSCTERGFPKPANPATREWQEGYFICEDCFEPLLQNLTNVPAEEARSILPPPTEPPSRANGSEDNGNHGNLPILDAIYEAYKIPKELQFDKVDIVQRNYDKIFNFHAPAVVNRTLEELAFENEQLAMSLFQIKYKLETLQSAIAKLKEERRKEKNLKSYDDSKESYAKSTPKKSSAVKQTQEEKMAKTLGMTVEAYRELQKKAREREFNKMAGNCAECGATMPCSVHPSK